MNSRSFSLCSYGAVIYEVPECIKEKLDYFNCQIMVLLFLFTVFIGSHLFLSKFLYFGCACSNKVSYRELVQHLKAM